MNRKGDPRYKFLVSRSKQGMWYWSLCYFPHPEAAGRVIADAGGYDTRRSCILAIGAVRRAADRAVIEMVD